VQREDALDALAEGHLAHREGSPCRAAVLANHDPLEDLDPLLVALADLDVHAHRIARPHRGPLRELRPFH
jgi:hypothetical protein